MEKCSIFSKKFIVVLLALIQILAFIMLTTRLYTIGSAIYVVLIMFSIGVMLGVDGSIELANIVAGKRSLLDGVVCC